MNVNRYYLTCKKCYEEGPHVKDIFIEPRNEYIPLCSNCNFNLLERFLSECEESSRVLDDFINHL